MPVISVPSIGNVQFPDDMSDEQIVQAIERDILPQPSTGSLFTAGVRRGAQQLGSLMGDVLPGMVGRMVGADDYANRQFDEARQTDEEIRRTNPPRYRNYEDVQGVGDAVGYAAETLGEQIPQLATALVPGGLGASLGARAAGAGATAAARAAMATRGAVVGAGVGSAAQNFPDSYQSIMQNTGREAMGPALAAGAINTALDTIFPAYVLSRLPVGGREAVIGSLMRRLGIGAAMGVASEGATEGTQEAVNAAAESFVDETRPFWSSENFTRVVDAAIRGAITGGVVGGVTDAATGQTPQDARRQRDQTLQRSLQDIAPPQQPIEMPGEPGVADPAAPAQEQPVEEPVAQEEPVPEEAPIPTSLAQESEPVEPPPVAASPQPEGNAAPAAPAPPVEPVAQPSLASRIFGAYQAASPGMGRNIPIADIRAALPDVPRNVLDAELARLAGSGQTTLQPFATPGDPRRGPAGSEQRQRIDAGRLQIGQFARDLIGFDRPLEQAQQPPAQETAQRSERGEQVAPTQTAVPDVRIERARQVVEQRLGLIRGMGQQGVKAAQGVEDAIRSGQFTPPQLVAAFHYAENAARILGDRSLAVQFVPELLNGTDEAQGGMFHLSPGGTNGLIKFSLSDSSIRYAGETAAHEAFHVAQRLFARSEPNFAKVLDAAFPAGKGLAGVDPTIRRRLQTLRGPQGKGSVWDYLNTFPRIAQNPDQRELQAYVFGALDDAKRRGENLTGIRPSLLRFVNFFAEMRQRLGNALKGAGFKSANDVMGSVSEGIPARMKQAEPLSMAPEQTSFRPVPPPREQAPQEQAQTAEAPQAETAPTESPQLSSRGTPTTMTPAIQEAMLRTSGPVRDAPPWLHRILAPIVGAREGEDLGKAFMRNTIAQNAYGYAADAMHKANGNPNMAVIGKALDMAANSTANIEYILEHGYIGYDPSKPEFDGFVPRKDVPALLDVLLGADRKTPLFKPDEVDVFQAYLAQLRERDLMKNGRQGLTGSTPAKVDSSIKDFEAQHPGWKTGAAELQKINEAALDLGVKTGVLEPSKAKELASMFYTPFYRVVEKENEAGQKLALQDGKGTVGPAIGSSLNNPQAFAKAVHESGPIGNLFENLIKNQELIIRSARKNVALKATTQSLAQLRNDRGQPLARRIASRSDGMKNVVEYKEGGKTVLYQLDPTDNIATGVFMAMVGLPQAQRSAIFKAAASMAHWFRVGVTSTPSFMLASLYRGRITTYTQAGTALMPNVARGIKEALTSSQNLQEFQAISGYGGFDLGMGAADQAKTLARRMRTGAGDASLMDRVRNGVDKIQRISESIDSAERLMVMEDRLKKGASKSEAAYAALMVAPFSRHGMGEGVLGQSIRWLTPVVPFLNAKMQGISRMFENDTGAKRIKALAGMPADIALRASLVTAFSVGLYALASQDERWKDEPPDRKLTNDIIYTPMGRVYLPRAFEFGTFFGALPVFMLDAIQSDTGPGDMHKAIVSAFFSTVGFNPIPQPVLPILETIANYDAFRMRPIENPAMQNLPVLDRRSETTSRAASAVAEGMSYVDAILPQSMRMNVSPVKAQRLLEGYTGALGTMMFAAADTFMGAAGLIPERPAGVFGPPSSAQGILATVLNANRFFRDDSEMVSRFVGEFYEVKRQADQLYASLRDAQRVGNTARLQQITPAEQRLLGLREPMDGAEQRLSDINRRMRTITESDQTGSQEQRREELVRLRQERNEIARRAMDVIRPIQRGQ